MWNNYGFVYDIFSKFKDFNILKGVGRLWGCRGLWGLRAIQGAPRPLSAPAAFHQAPAPPCGTVATASPQMAVNGHLNSTHPLGCHLPMIPRLK